MWGTNSLYIINMPLFIIDELHLPEKLAGIMMETAAGLEIPTMLIAGYYAKRFGKRLMRNRRRCRAAVLCRHADGPYASAASALQLLNAIYIGILAGIGMLLLPGSDAGSGRRCHHPLYYNTTRVGWIIAGSLAGVVAEIWNYHTVFWIALVMCVRR